MSGPVLGTTRYGATSRVPRRSLISLVVTILGNLDMKNQLNQSASSAPRLLAALLAGATLFGASAASAFTYYDFAFGNITNQSPQVGNLLNLQVSDDPSAVFFRVQNLADPSTNMFIDSVWFDWKTPASLSGLAFSSAQSSSGVQYDPPGQPGDPPGSNKPSLNWSTDAGFQPHSHDNSDAIRGGQTGAFTASASLSDVKTWLDSGALRLAIHVQGIPNGSSDTYVTYNNGSDGPNPPASVPVPAAVWLFGSALAGFMTLSNRRKLS